MMVDGGALVVFTHQVAVFVVGSDFDTVELVLKLHNIDCDSVLSEGSPCIDSETGTQHFQR